MNVLLNMVKQNVFVHPLTAVFLVKLCVITDVWEEENVVCLNKVYQPVVAMLVTVVTAANLRRV